MDEINLWLKENSIEDREIINCINKRNLSYIEMILTKKDIKETDIDFEKIKNITKEFNLKDLKNSKFIDEKTFQKMFELKNNPEKFYSKIKKKDFIKNLFSIKWNKQEKKIVLFGKIWSIQ